MRSRKQFDSHRRVRGELGAARLNFLIVIATIALVAYSAYNYVPVAFGAFRYRDFMQETVNKAAFVQNQPTSWAEVQLRTGAREFGLPPDVKVTVQRQNGQIVANARWTKPVRLPGYIYDYEFDHTARSSSFFNSP